jgi:hypothetical protein
MVIIVHNYPDVLRSIEDVPEQKPSRFFAAHAILVACCPQDMQRCMEVEGTGDMLVTAASKVSWLPSFLVAA